MDKQTRHDDKAVGARLRQRLAQILVRSSCVTTTATTATAFVGLAATATSNNNAAADPVNAHQEPRSGPKPNDKRCQPRRRHNSSEPAALVHTSIDCSARSAGAAAVLPSPMLPRPANFVGGVRAVTTSKNRNKETRASSTYYHGWSSSSTDGEPAATSSMLFSSRSFSSDSTSDIYNTNTTGSKRRDRNRRRPIRLRAADDDDDMLRKKTGSTAVVKRSHDPYADFRSSMVEMVVGRPIRGAEALTELLVSYLSLNSPRHHPVIVTAFHDVWEAVVYDR